MCGIIGCKGGENAIQTAFSGLKRLEYRGYDSWGIASIDGDDVNVHKQTGKITSLPPSLENKKAGLAISHSRWATHGGVTEENAHPHTDCTGNIAVVHNGIIENHEELREGLEAKGHKFKSECDSEVLAHLIEEEKGELKDAVRKALKKVKGSYAVLVIRKGSEELVGARNESPMVIGKADGQFFLASDVPAFLEYTNTVAFVEDGEMVVLNSRPQLFDIESGDEKEIEWETVDWSLEEASKGDFEHYMIKEISEQKESILRAASHEDKTLMDVAQQINDAFGVFFVACGSSYHAALTASYIFSKVAKKHINVVHASEFPYYEHFLTDKTLMIPISQSGETADVLAAVKAAKKKGTNILSLVNVMGSTLMRESDYSLTMNSGPEIGVLSTKTYTSQVTILTLLAYACIKKLGEGKEIVKKAAEAAEELVSAESRIKLVELASKLHEQDHMFSIGRGTSYPTALEAALKIKEVTYVNCIGFCGGEAKHGSIALVYKGMPCLVFSPNDETKAEILSNASELKARGGYIIGISPQNNKVFDYHIRVPDIGDGNAIVDIIPIQIFSYYLAMLRGCDPDMPRALAKSVTVK